LQCGQWQGSSHRDAPLLMKGSDWLFEVLNYLPFEHIEVGRNEPSRKREHVLAKTDLLWHAEQMKQLIDAKKPSRIVTLGGDCGVDFLPITYLNKLYRERFAVIWIDAHPDLHVPASSPNSAFRTMVLRACMGDGATMLQDYAYSKLAPLNTFLAAVRKFDPHEFAFFEDNKMKLFPFQDLAKRPESLTDYLDLLEIEKVHIHFDLDALSPEAFSATGYPEAEGLSLLDANLLLKAIYNAFEVVGFTLSEFMPKQKEDLQALMPLLASNPLL